MPKDKDILLRKVGLNIQNIRKEKGMTQADLASNVNKDQQSIQRLEKGKINASIYYLSEIAKGLDVDLIELLKT